MKGVDRPAPKKVRTAMGVYIKLMGFCVLRVLILGFIL